MQTYTWLVSGMTSAAVVLLPLTAAAQDRPETEGKKGVTVRMSTMMHVFKASDLIGKHVTNPQGERMGEIDDLVVDVDSGRIAYAVLEFGGFLGIGDKLFAIPWASLDLTAEGKKFVLDVSKEKLKAAPGFDKRHWPDMADREWATDVHKYYGQRYYWEIKTPRVRVLLTGSKDMPKIEPALHIQKASDLIGKRVKNPKGEELGKIHDLVIDYERGRVALAVLEFGGFLGLGEKLFAIPWGALEMSEGDKYVILDVDKERLKNAPGFERNNWPDLNDRKWHKDVFIFYGQEPYWDKD